MDSLNGSNPFAGSNGGAPISGFTPDMTSNVGFNSSMNNLSGSLQQELGLNGSGANNTATVGSDLGNIGGIVGGLQQGGAMGYATAAGNAARLAANNGVFGSSTGAANTDIGGAGNLLGAYQGFETGGVTGDAQGATNVAEIGAKAGAFGATADSTILSKAPIVGDALAVYNFAKGWQSGNTASDAESGAQTGATIGSAFGPVGTVVGGVIGAAGGALSSAFGGGEKDPETQDFNSVVAANAKTGNNGVIAQLSPSQAYQSLAGMMDAKNNSAGHSTALEQVFGRMGEGNLMTQMAGQINQAISGGNIAKNATPQQIYQQVVTPWLQSKGAYVAPNATISSNGTANNGAVDALLTQMIGQWQSGALNNAVGLGVDGQTISTLPGYAGAPQTASGAEKGDAYFAKLQQLVPNIGKTGAFRRSGNPIIS